MVKRIRLKAVERVQNKSEGLVYFENNAEAWNVVIQYLEDDMWYDVDLVLVDPAYSGIGEKAEKIN